MNIYTCIFIVNMQVFFLVPRIKKAKNPKKTGKKSRFIHIIVLNAQELSRGIRNTVQDVKMKENSKNRVDNEYLC